MSEMDKYIPHYSSKLASARDHLSALILDLRSAEKSIDHPDHAKILALLDNITNNVTPLLTEVRNDSQSRKHMFRALNNFPDMLADNHPQYTDERPRMSEEPIAPSAVPTKEPYSLEAPNTHMGKLHIELYGAEDDSEQAAGAVSEMLTAFENGTQDRDRALTALRTELNSMFLSGTYEMKDVQSFIDSVKEKLEPGAHEWQAILDCVNRAMDKFDPGDPERQEILSWLYLTIKKRPESLIMPSVGSDESGRRLIVRHENLVVYEQTDDELDD